MNKLSFLVLFALVYLSMAETTLKHDQEKPIKVSTLAPSTSSAKPVKVSTLAPSASSVKPNRGIKLTETFKKIVDEMKKVKTGIEGWNNLTAGQCRRMHGRNSKSYRCIAYIPKEGKSKGWSMMLQVYVNLKSGSVELYNVQNDANEVGGLVPVSYDIWSDMRDNILKHTKVNCQIHWGKEPNNCEISISTNN